MSIFKFIRNELFDNETKNVDVVRFNMSRYGDHQYAIKFEKFLTIEEAIFEVEKFLSEVITEDYFNVVKDDLFCGDKLTWIDAQERFKIKGDILGDAKFLESVSLFHKDIDNSIIICLETGS